MEVLANSSSFASHLAGEGQNFDAFQPTGLLAKTWAQFNIWTVLLTLLVLGATYDQCEPEIPRATLLGALRQGIDTLLQLAISFGSMALSARPGKCPSWAHSWNQ